MTLFCFVFVFVLRVGEEARNKPPFILLHVLDSFFLQLFYYYYPVTIRIYIFSFFNFYQLLLLH